MNVSLRQLRAFVAVARIGSFTEAARQLHLTQSAVSMLVRQLEAELGLPLFDRAHRAVALTETGRALLPLAQRMLDDLRQVIDGADDLRALRRGTLRVAVSQMLACTWIAPAIAGFEAGFPDIELRITDTTPDDIVSAVQRGEAEIGIGPDRPSGDDIESSFLMNVPIRLVCRSDHPLAERRRVTWQQLRHERWVVYSAEFHRALERRLHAHDATLTIRPATEVAYPTTALALVGAGLGITAAPDYAGALAPHFGVRFVTLHAPAIERAFFVYHRRGQAISPASAEFVHRIRARARLAPARRPARGGGGPKRGDTKTAAP